MALKGRVTKPTTRSIGYDAWTLKSSLFQFGIYLKSSVAHPAHPPNPDGPHCEIGATFQEIFKSIRVESEVNLGINSRPVLNQLPSIEIRLHCSARR